MFFIGLQGSPSLGLPENADKVFVQGIILSVVALLLEPQSLDCQKCKIQILCLGPYTASLGRVLQGCFYLTCFQQVFLTSCQWKPSLFWRYFLPYLLVLDLITGKEGSPYLWDQHVNSGEEPSFGRPLSSPPPRVDNLLGFELSAQGMSNCS